MPLAMALTTSLVQRSPHRFPVTLAESVSLCPSVILPEAGALVVEDVVAPTVKHSSELSSELPP